MPFNPINPMDPFGLVEKHVVKKIPGLKQLNKFNPFSLEAQNRFKSRKYESATGMSSAFTDKKLGKIGLSTPAQRTQYWAHVRHDNPNMSAKNRMKMIMQQHKALPEGSNTSDFLWQQGYATDANGTVRNSRKLQAELLQKQRQMQSQLDMYKSYGQQGYYNPYYSQAQQSYQQGYPQQGSLESQMNAYFQQLWPAYQQALADQKQQQTQGT